MQLIILPLSYEDRDRQIQAIDECIELAQGISDDDVKAYVLSGMAVFTDKIIGRLQSDRIRREVNMTKVGALFAKEIDDARIEERREVIERALRKGNTPEAVAEFIDIPLEEVLSVYQSMKEEIA